MKLKLVSTLTVGLFVVSCVAELQRFEHAAKPDGSLSFLVVGDWGRRGHYNQSQVALQMGLIGEKIGIDFVISTGDNFYGNGLTGVGDPAFHESFTDIYTAPSLQKQWYTVLGNHDYRGNVEAQLSPILRKIDSRWLCLRSFILNAGPEMAEFFFVDTTPFVSKYFTDPQGHVYDWRGILPRRKYLNRILMEVESALRESSTTWKIVVGHHPIMSAGHHGNTDELSDGLLPLLQAYEVDLYINGHDHCLEHISSSESGIQFMTSGGGSKAWRGDVATWKNPQEMEFYHDGQGFMSVEMTGLLDVIGCSYFTATPLPIQSTLPLQFSFSGWEAVSAGTLSSVAVVNSCDDGLLEPGGGRKTPVPGIGRQGAGCLGGGAGLAVEPGGIGTGA